MNYREMMAERVRKLAENITKYQDCDCDEFKCVGVSCPVYDDRDLLEPVVTPEMMNRLYSTPERERQAMLRRVVCV